MYDRRVAKAAERASETARQEPGLTRRYNDNTPMCYINNIYLLTTKLIMLMITATAPDAVHTGKAFDGTI